MSMRAERISRLYDGLRAVDTLIAKAIRVDELAQTARIETKLREYIAVQWEDLAKQASRTATARLRKGKGPVTDAEITRINKLIDRTMEQWSGRIADRYTEDLREVYELAHIAANKRALGRRKRGMEFNTRPWDTGEVEKAAPIPAAEIGVNFDLVDLQNMDAFEDQQLFWIGQHYDENVSKHVHDTARTHIIEQGRGRVEAGKTMQKVVSTALNEVRIPGGFNGTAKKYFEGLVANSATVQRNTAQLNSFTRAGFTKIIVVNPSDHRTCPRCDLMNGREFKISDANKIATSLRNAKDPTDVRKIQPFMSAADAKLSNSALVERGNIFAPYHFKCFLGETPVLTREGLKRIDSVQVGDEVLTHRLRWRRVEAVLHQWHHGEFLEIEGVTSTADHPYLLKRGKQVIFSVVADGDRIATLRQSPNQVRQLREDFLRIPVEVGDAPLLLKEMYESESLKSRKFKTNSQGQTSSQEMSALRSVGNTFRVACRKVSLLLHGVSTSWVSQGHVGKVLGVWPRLLASSIGKTFWGGHVFANVSMETLEANRYRPQVWSQEGAIRGIKQPDARSRTWARKVVEDQDAVARRDIFEKFLGRTLCEGTLGSRREVFVRTPTLRVARRDHLSTRLLSAEARSLGRGEGLEQATGSLDSKALSREVDLGSAGGNEAIVFVRPRVVRHFQDCRDVWNLTVAEDESFVVGEVGLVVHNCRCNIDITEGEELIPLL